MQGKTIVITGGTSGIGEVAAIRLAEQGARIVLHRARSRARADARWRSCARPIARRGSRRRIADLSRIAEMKRVGGGDRGASRRSTS